MIRMMALWAITGAPFLRAPTSVAGLLFLLVLLTIDQDLPFCIAAGRISDRRVQLRTRR